MSLQENLSSVSGPLKAEDFASFICLFELVIWPSQCCSGHVKHISLRTHTFPGRA